MEGDEGARRTIKQADDAKLSANFSGMESCWVVVIVIIEWLWEKVGMPTNTLANKLVSLAEYRE